MLKNFRLMCLRLAAMLAWFSNAAAVEIDARDLVFLGQGALKMAFTHEAYPNKVFLIANESMASMKLIPISAEGQRAFFNKHVEMLNRYRNIGVRVPEVYSEASVHFMNGLPQGLSDDQKYIWSSLQGSQFIKEGLITERVDFTYRGINQLFPKSPGVPVQDLSIRRRVHDLVSDHYEEIDNQWRRSLNAMEAAGIVPDDLHSFNVGLSIREKPELVFFDPVSERTYESWKALWKVYRDGEYHVLNQNGKLPLRRSFMTRKTGYGFQKLLQRVRGMPRP